MTTKQNQKEKVLKHLYEWCYQREEMTNNLLEVMEFRLFEPYKKEDNGQYSAEVLQAIEKRKKFLHEEINKQQDELLIIADLQQKIDNKEPFKNIIDYCHRKLNTANLTQWEASYMQKTNFIAYIYAKFIYYLELFENAE